MRNANGLGIGLFSMILFSVSAVQAFTPTMVHYQGRLVDGTNLVNGTVGLTIHLYNTSFAGTPAFSDSNNVMVVDGLYNTIIGDTPIGGNLVNALTNNTVWLEAVVNGVTLTPREQVVAVPFSMNTRGLHVTGNTSVIFHPNFNQISTNALGVFIGGGSSHVIGINSSFATISGGQFNSIQTNSSFSAIGGGVGNRIGSLSPSSTIVGGNDNQIATNTSYATVGGGQQNRVGSVSDYSTISGGGANVTGTNTLASFIGGGYGNEIRQNSHAATIVGGQFHVISTNANNASILGGVSHNIRAGAASSVITGGSNNDIGVNSTFGIIAGGSDNVIQFSTPYATISGGRENVVGWQSELATISGGRLNLIENSAVGSTIGGGRANLAANSAQWGTIGGGASNRVLNSSVFATVPGGVGNMAGSYSFAAGRRARAIHSGSFVWGDNTNADIDTTDDNQFIIRAQNGLGVNVVPTGGGIAADFGGRTRVRGTAPGNPPGIWMYDNSTSNDRSFVGNSDSSHIGFYGHHGGGWGFMMNVSNGFIGVGGVWNPAHPIHAVSGAHLTAGGTWVSVSDVNKKRDFEAIDTADILKKVAALPITTWSYTADPGVRHIGPSAQDFHAAFGVGPGETSISQIDPDGVALAAIQALARENEALKQENEAIRAELENIKKKIGM